MGLTSPKILLYVMFFPEFILIKFFFFLVEFKLSLHQDIGGSSQHEVVKAPTKAHVTHKKKITPTNSNDNRDLLQSTRQWVYDIYRLKLC